MANEVRWTGDAVAIVQQDTITVGVTWIQGETITLTINGKDLVVTVGSSVTTANVATLLKEAINGDTLTDTTAACSPKGTGYTISAPVGGGPLIPEFAEVTAEVSAAVVTVTGDTAGKPFFCCWYCSYCSRRCSCRDRAELLGQCRQLGYRCSTRQ
jgi:hypothetical protein